MESPALAVVLAQTAEEPAAVDCSRIGEGASETLCTIAGRLFDNQLLATTLASVVPLVLRVFLVLVVAWVLNRLARKLIRRFIEELKDKGLERLGALRSGTPLAASQPLNLQRATMRTETIGTVLRSLASVAIWTVALLMVLGEFDVNLGPLIAGAGIIGIALGFGAQRLVQDFLTGIFMLVEDQYGVGDIVDVGEATGVVESVSLRTTRVRDVYGVMWHIPNGEIRRVGNMSQLWSRALLDIGVSYETDLDEATDVIRRTALELYRDENWSEQFIDEPEVWGVQELADNQITIRLVMKVVPAQQWAIERELRGRIKKAFDAAGIEIPYPQRTIWVRQDDGGAGPNGHARSDAADHEWGPSAS